MLRFAVTLNFYLVTLTFDLWCLSLNICSVPAVPWSHSVPNLSEMRQSALESLQFDIWPCDLEYVSYVTLCSGIVCAKFKLRQAICSWNVMIFTVRLWSICTVLLSTSVCPSVKRVHCDKTKASSEKSSTMTIRKSSTSFPMSLRWNRTLPLTPKGGLKSEFFSIFHRKNWAFLEESLLQSFFVWKLSAAKL